MTAPRPRFDDAVPIAAAFSFLLGAALCLGVGAWTGGMILGVSAFGFACVEWLRKRALVRPCAENLPGCTLKPRHTHRRIEVRS